jgi:hypothetical protein
MKNILLVSMVVLGLTSCSKDSLDQADQLVLPGKSEIMVRVSYLNWSNQCGTGCGSNTSGDQAMIANAVVALYKGEQNNSDAPGTSIMDARTDADGSALLKDIDPAVYTVWVETSMGKKSRTITTQLHRRSSIDFSF